MYSPHQRALLSKAVLQVRSFLCVFASLWRQLTHCRMCFRDKFALAEERFLTGLIFIVFGEQNLLFAEKSLIRHATPLNN